MSRPAQHGRRIRGDETVVERALPGAWSDLQLPLGARRRHLVRRLSARIGKVEAENLIFSTAKQCTTTSNTRRLCSDGAILGLGKTLESLRGLRYARASYSLIHWSLFSFPRVRSVDVLVM